jgi:1,4-alpha-glucan branching enzyme
MKKRTNNKTGVGLSSSHATRFELVRPEAHAVFVAGSCNDWHPTTFTMICGDGGKWVKELALPPGRYEYLFVVDGVWVEDSTAVESMHNPYGGVNSVVVVPANAQ